MYKATKMASELPIVNFGKYKDKPVTDLIADKDYLEWCKKQEWFKKHTTIYNICVNQTLVTNSSSKTPEHNKIQNLFLDEAFVRKFHKKDFEKHSCIFEFTYNWDVRLSITGKTYVNRYGHEDFLEPIYYIEVKPVLGDDYPSVLRKMSTQILLTEKSDMLGIYVLLIDKFESAITTKDQLITIFKQSQIKVKFLSDIIGDKPVGIPLIETKQELVKNEPQVDLSRIYERFGNKCAVSKCEQKEVLQITKIDQNNKDSDLIVLRADFRILFDLYMFSINPDKMKIEMMSDLDEMYAEVLTKNKKLKLELNDKELIDLRAHYIKFNQQFDLDAS